MNMKMKLMGLVFVATAAFSIVQTVAAATFDHSLFNRILNEYVDDKGLVDYNGIAKDKNFYAYMDALKNADVQTLTKDGQLAFWINAYNAVTIEKVIRWKPKKSVRETIVPGVWISTKFFTTRENEVAGKKMSQDDIENDILRKQFHDPRIHFAIICASMGCPPIPKFAYTGEMVQSQLESETRKYLNSPRGTRIDRAKNTLYISKVFDWFKDDFIKAAGSVMNFIKPYLNEETLRFLETNPKIDYIEYNWALNAREPLK
jgi:Protein of unknown function, DUF547